MTDDDGNDIEMTEGTQPEDSLTFLKPAPWNITFNRDGVAIGRLDFSGDKMRFVGDADLAAKQFFDAVIMQWSDKIREMEVTIQKLIVAQNKRA